MAQLKTTDWIAVLYWVGVGSEKQHFGLFEILFYSLPHYSKCSVKSFLEIF